MKTDKQLHIICSAAITLTLGAPAALIVGALVEVNDRQKFNCPVKHCCEDMAFNVAGVALALLIKKLLK